MKVRLHWILLGLLTCSTCFGQFTFRNLPFMAATASGTLPISLAAYWSVDDAANVTRVDSVSGAENLTDLNGDVGITPGVINNAANMGVVTTKLLKHADDAVLGIGAGVSFTIQAWVKDGGTHDAGVVTKWDTSNSALQDYRLFIGPNGNFGNGFYWFGVKNLAGTEITLVSPIQDSGLTTYRHLVAGYDDSLQQIWVQIDNGVRISTNCVGVRRTAVDFGVGNYANVGGNPVAVDEVGFWRRSLTLQEVATLYNSGSAVAFANLRGAAGGTPGIALSAYTSSWWQTVYSNSGDPSNNGGAVSSTQLMALDGLYTALNAASLLSKTVALNCLVQDNIVACMWPFLGVGGALPTAKWTNIGFAGPGTDLTVNGLIGNGTSKSINTGINLSTALSSINSAAFVVYVTTTVTEAKWQMGLYNGPSDSGVAFALDGPGDVGSIGSINQLASTTTHGTGYFCLSRTSSTALNLYFANSTTPHSSIASQTGANVKTFPNDSHFAMFADYDPNAGAVALWSAKRMSAGGIFSGLSAADSLNLYTALQAYFVARGGGFQ